MEIEFDTPQQEREEGEGIKDGTYVPEGYKTQQEFLDRALKMYDADMRFDKDNRAWAKEDLQFAAGDQWDPDAKKQREDKFRPCMTINVFPVFIGQVVGDRRMNETAIKVRPWRSGTQEVADLRSGLIKSIEYYSRANRAYDAACEDQTACGIANLRVDMEYAGNDVFDQDIRIRHIPDPLSVVWDFMSVDITGRDAKHCFVDDAIPLEVFKARFKDVDVPATSSNGFGFSNDTTRSSKWIEGEMVRITEFWELIEKPAVIALLNNGEVEDVTDPEARAKVEDQIFINPKTGKQMVRNTFRTYARMHMITSFAILGEAYEIPLSRLPIIKVEGRSIRVGQDRVRFGLVRFAKDSIRLKNYWRSVAAEVLALAPKAQWLATAKAVEGREKEFRENALTGDPLLIRNEAGELARVEPPAIPAALLQEAQMNQQDIKDVTGLHDASLGIRSNEVSGKAINARKMEGDIATIIYHDNLNESILEVGCVVNEMIPLCYDSVRMVRVIGEDNKHKLVTINDPNDNGSVDITQGKYDVVLDTGPSFATQRMEAFEAFMNILQTGPEIFPVIGDKVMENLDVPGAHEIAARLFNMVPEQVLSPEDKEKRLAEQPQPEGDPMQEAVQQAQMQEGMAQLQHAEQMRQIELATASANAQKAEADARKAEADAEKAQAEAAIAGVSAQLEPVRQVQDLANSDEATNQDLQHARLEHIQALTHKDEAHAADMLSRGQQALHTEDSHQQGMSLAEQAAQQKAEQPKAAPSNKKD